MSLVLCLLMLCSCIVGAAGDVIPDGGLVNDAEQTQEQTQAPMFSDVPVDASYAAGVKKLVEYGIISGYPDGTFKPYGEVTRAEMCKMINLALGYTDITETTGFTDVTTSNWYYAFALAAQKAGYIQGYEDGSFGGGRNITRQEVCAILVRLLKPMNLGIPVTINDNVSNWARPDVELVVQNFIMPLEQGNTFRATENLKRHELATVLSNIAIGPVKAIEANVRFFVNGEQYTETQIVEVGNTAIPPIDPVPYDETYVFYGWRVIGTIDATDVSSMIVSGDVDYEAVFKKITHNVVFNVNSSNYYSTECEHLEVVIAPQNPALKGFTFLGWSLSPDGSIIKLSETAIVEDTTFYAVFKKESEESEGGGGPGGSETVKKYTVSFFVNGDLYDSQSVEKGKTPKAPAVPSREGYDFVGWSFDVDGDIISLSAIDVSKNITLYAVFEKTAEPEPEKYTVTFVSDGGSFAVQTVEEGKAPDNPGNPSKDGYNFVGWSKSENGATVILGYVTIASDTTFYAVFEQKQIEKKYFDVNFYADGKLHDSVTVEEGKTTSAPQAPTKDGYNFMGWSINENGTAVNVGGVKITANINFYALFEKKPEEIVYFDVTFVADGKVHDSQSVKKGEAALKPADAEKDGYKFLGWSKDKTNVIDVTKASVTSDMTFYAVFEKIEEVKVYYTVKFVSDGKTVDTQQVLDGEYPIVPDEPQKNGYEFLGWSKTENGSTVKPDALKVLGNVTYYAVFEEIVVETKYYTVRFVVNGDELTSYEVAEGGYAAAPEVSGLDSLSAFVGWSTRANAGENDIVDVESTSINKNMTFYAVIIKNPNDPELIEKLNRGYTQLKKIRASNTKHKAAIAVFVECIGYVIEDVNNGTYIDKSYILDYYSDYISEVHGIVNEEMTDKERSNFINMITNPRNIDEDVQEFIIDYFDIETSI